MRPPCPSPHGSLRPPGWWQTFSEETRPCAGSLAFGAGENLARVAAVHCCPWPHVDDGSVDATPKGWLVRRRVAACFVSSVGFAREPVESPFHPCRHRAPRWQTTDAWQCCAGAVLAPSPHARLDRRRTVAIASIGIAGWPTWATPGIRLPERPPYPPRVAHMGHFTLASPESAAGAVTRNTASAGRLWSDPTITTRLVDAAAAWQNLVAEVRPCVPGLPACWKASPNPDLVPRPVRGWPMWATARRSTYAWPAIAPCCLSLQAQAVQRSAATGDGKQCGMCRILTFHPRVAHVGHLSRLDLSLVAGCTGNGTVSMWPMWATNDCSSGQRPRLHTEAVGIALSARSDTPCRLRPRERRARPSRVAHVGHLHPDTRSTGPRLGAYWSCAPAGLARAEGGPCGPPSRQASSAAPAVNSRLGASYIQTAREGLRL